MSVYVCACHLNLVSLVAFSLVNLSNEKFPRKTGTKRGYNSSIKKCVLWVQNNGFWLFKKTVNHLNNPHKNPRSLSDLKSLNFGFFMFGGDLRGVLGGQGCGMCELLD